MSIAKKALDLPKNSQLRKEIEVFLSGKPAPVDSKKMSLLKGNIVETKDGFIGEIVKYSSNKEIHIKSEWERGVYQTEKIVTNSLTKIYDKVEIIRIVEEDIDETQKLESKKVIIKIGDRLKMKEYGNGTLEEIQSDSTIYVIMDNGTGLLTFKDNVEAVL